MEQTESTRTATEEFVQLFTRGQRGLYLFILAQVGHVQMAEEILQETNLIIWAKADQFQPNTNFNAWTRQIAVYEVMKARQQRKRDKLTFSDEFMQAVSEESLALTTSQEQRQEALRHCLEKLSEADRELINQRYQPGASGKQLAKDLGRPANSVYQSLGRIRRALAECIQREIASAEVRT